MRFNCLLDREGHIYSIDNASTYITTASLRMAQIWAKTYGHFCI